MFTSLLISEWGVHWCQEAKGEVLREEGKAEVEEHNQQ